MAPDNTILHPIAFASKNLTGAEQRYSNIECEGAWNTTRVGKVSPLLLWQKGTHHYRPQTTCINVLKRCSHIVTVHSAHIAKNSPI